jgi:hypothetical protein
MMWLRNLPRRGAHEKVKASSLWDALYREFGGGDSSLSIQFEWPRGFEGELAPYKKSVHGKAVRAAQRD